MNVNEYKEGKEFGDLKESIPVSDNNNNNKAGLLQFLAQEGILTDSDARKIKFVVIIVNRLTNLLTGIL